MITICHNICEIFFIRNLLELFFVNFLQPVWIWIQIEIGSDLDQDYNVCGSLALVTLLPMQWGEEQKLKNCSLTSTPSVATYFFSNSPVKCLLTKVVFPADNLFWILDTKLIFLLKQTRCKFKIIVFFVKNVFLTLK